MPKVFFKSAAELASLVDAYFNGLHISPIPDNDTGIKLQNKAANTTAEPATITGLALFLGFNCRQAFSNYERKGKFADELKRGKLRIESIYEKKLHQQPATGAIFALKNLGWHDKDESQTNSESSPKNLNVVLTNAEVSLAGNEKDIIDANQ